MLLSHAYVMVDIAKELRSGIVLLVCSNGFPRNISSDTGL